MKNKVLDDSSPFSFKKQDHGSIKAEYRKVIDDLAPHGSYVIYPIGGTFEFVPHFLEERFTYGMGFYHANPANR